MPVGAFLQVEQVTMSFGGLKALDGVSLELHRGEILGLIGPNGAGKTTLFNVIAGVCRPDRGRVLLEGRNITALQPFQRCHLGISRTFQITKPFLNMSLIENLAVGAYYGKPGRMTQGQARDRAVEILDQLGLGALKDGTAHGLSLGQRKKLELCRALASTPTILLLDEVVAGLTPSEVDEMIHVIGSIHATGVTVLIIEHVLKAVMAVSQRIVVLNFGKRLAEGPPQEIVRNEAVIQAYLGGMARHA
jgi:branched-chain amino acid transport system ATP-binding protein